MEGITWGGVAAMLGLCCSLCSVAAFYFGRRKAATDEAKEDGEWSSDLKYIKESLRDTSKSIDALTIKLEAQGRQREQDYRDLLVKYTELNASYKSLHLRVDSMQSEIAKYHHH